MPELVIALGRPWEMHVDGETVPLRPAEWTMIRCLAENVGHLVTWNLLYASLWAHETLAEPGQMYSHASRVRTKLRQALDAEPDWFRTVPKKGLCLDLRKDQVQILGGIQPAHTKHRPGAAPRRSPARSYGRKSY